MAPVVAREAGTSLVTARQAVVEREAGASRVAPVALMRPRGSGGVGGGSGGGGRRRRQSGATANWGDGGEGKGFGEEVVAGGGKPLFKWNVTVARS